MDHNTELAGKDPFDVLLHECLYGGKNHFGMRLLANGKFMRLEVCRSSVSQARSRVSAQGTDATSASSYDHGATISCYDS